MKIFSRFPLAVIILLSLLATSLLPAAHAKAAAAAQQETLPSALALEIKEAQYYRMLSSSFFKNYNSAVTKLAYHDAMAQLYYLLTDIWTEPTARIYKDEKAYSVRQLAKLGLLKTETSKSFNSSAKMGPADAKALLKRVLAKAASSPKLAKSGFLAPNYADRENWSNDQFASLTASDLTLSVADTVALTERSYKRFGILIARSEFDLGKAAALRVKFVIQDAESRKVYEAAKKLLSSAVKPGMDDFAKELAIHDALADKVSYDWDALDDIFSDAYWASGALLRGKAVCQGYAYALELLLNMAGIEAHFISGEALTKDWSGHAWVKANIDGSYTNIDVTWNDQDEQGPNDYTYFNVTDKEFSYDHRADEEFWPAAVDTSVGYYKKTGKWVDDEETYLRLINEAIASGAAGISLRFGNDMDMDNLPVLGSDVWDKLESFGGSGDGRMRTMTYVFRYKTEADLDNVGNS